MGSISTQDGPCQSWLIGHKLVTIKTSQCSRVATRRGLCDRCWLLCKLDPDEVNSDAGEAAAASAAASAPDLAGGFRRRHRSAISSMAGLASLDLPAVTSGAPDDFQTKLRSRHKSSVDDRRSSIDFDDPLRDPSGIFSPPPSFRSVRTKTVAKVHEIFIAKN